jgi:peptidoglycan/LPS O-acetylase OafA/YrhL
MNVQTVRQTRAEVSRASVAVDNLRGIVVLLVIAVHTVLCYAAYAVTGPWSFNGPPFPWRTFPVVDSHRFLGFDIFCAWANICLMPLFFLVSGFFVWNSLQRNGALRFSLRRIARLGPPFLLGIALVMPIAIYPAYAERTLNPSFGDYIHQLWTLPFWPDGPMWFLFILLIFDLTAAALMAAFPHAQNLIGQIAFRAGTKPKRFLAGLFVLSAVAYIPLGTIFGPMRWFQWGPFSFQLNFIGLYVVYFGAGIVIGASGLERGVLAQQFARNWKSWMLAAIVFFVAWLLVSAKTFTVRSASTGWMFADAVALAPACFASCICALLVAIRFGRVRTSFMKSLQANAFGMYWVHYAVLTWLQFALLSVSLPAIAKALLVFVAAGTLSWVIAASLRHVPVLNGVIGVPPRRARAALIPTLHSPLPLSD